MKNFKGLLQKEWLMNKWIVSVLLVLSFLVVFAGPIIIARIFEETPDFYGNAVILGGTWLVLLMFTGIFVLFTSLENELKQSELWLHSPASIFLLIGVKVFFASFVTLFVLTVTSLFIGIAFFLFGDAGVLHGKDHVLPLVSVVIALFKNSLYVMGIGFFFWSIYRVLTFRIGNMLSTLIAAIILFTGAFSWERLRITGFFDVFKSFMPVKLTANTFYNESNSYFFTGIVPNGVIFSVGTVLLFGAGTILLFVAGTVLFEKKVRL